jgi:hypothetical protein
MAIRDCSNMPDTMVPNWVRKSRERKRQIAKKYEFACEDWKRICREIEELKLKP